MAAVMRQLRDQRADAETDAETAAAMLAACPDGMRRAMALAQVRCPGGKLLLTLYKLPFDDARPNQISEYLMVPSSRARVGNDRQPAYWLAASWEWALSCRCHPGEWPFTVDMITGKADPPDGLRVVLI
ncbi:MAG: hypothetical protein DLM56_08685 [Pseudonocardiales bacterium]|nr:MAG: hypothetical protein DLM56_08685 [Pseudonocardiales bacterium]